MVEKRSERECPTIEDIIQDIAHQLGNPLHIIGGRVQLLLRKMPGDPYLVRNLHIITSQVEQMSLIIQEALRATKQIDGGESFGT